ncbi:hypothetical protein Fot_31856 [Forsythia ovata]|uniref:Uncharacterized protein n=1 Tax=Forsythia ovata TaxID=205694 RepID=A0ABD1T661_9LAMI
MATTTRKANGYSVHTKKPRNHEITIARKKHCNPDDVYLKNKTTPLRKGKIPTSLSGPEVRHTQGPQVWPISPEPSPTRLAHRLVLCLWHKSCFDKISAATQPFSKHRHTPSGLSGLS